MSLEDCRVFSFFQWIFLARDSLDGVGVHISKLSFSVVVELPGLGRAIDFSILNPSHFLPSCHDRFEKPSRVDGQPALLSGAQAWDRPRPIMNERQPSDLLAKGTVGWKNNARRGRIKMEITT